MENNSEVKDIEQLASDVSLKPDITNKNVDPNLELKPEHLSKDNDFIEQISETNSKNNKKKIKKKKKKPNKKDKSLQNHTVIDMNGSNSTKKYLLDYPFKSIKHETEKGFIFSMIKKLILIILNMVLIIPVAFYLCLVLPISYIFRLTFKFLHICHLTHASKYQDSIPEFLNPNELFWLLNSNLIDKASFKNRSNAVGSCLMFIEGSVTQNSLKNLIQTRILSTEHRCFVRFKQRLYNLWAYGYVWLNCDEATFELDEHISVIDDAANVIHTEEDLQVYMSNLISNHEFNIEKPLWKIYCKHDFELSDGEPDSNSEKGTVLIFIFHMCFGDGMSLIRIFFKSLVDNKNTIEIKPRFAYSKFQIEFLHQFFFNLNKILTSLIFRRSDKNPLHKDSHKSRIFKKLNDSIELNQTNPMGTFKEDNLVVGQRKNNVTSKKTRRILWSKPFSSLTLNRMKLITRSKFNDFIFAMIGGIIRDYLQNKGINHPQNMHCLIPIDLSCNKFPIKLHNNTTMSSLKLPSNVEGAVPSLWQTRSITKKNKNSGDYFFIYFVMHIVFKSLPNKLAAYLTRCLINKNTLLATSMGVGDSSLSTVSLCNQNVRDIIFMHPIFCKLGISFSIMNYGENVRLAIMIDPELFNNPEFIVKAFNKRLDTLNKLLAGRRIPGEIRRPVRVSIPGHSRKISDTKSTQSEESIEQMHTKLNKIYNEIQLLSDYCEKLDPTSPDYNNLKQLAYIKREKYKKDFREILTMLQDKQNLQDTISSDEEEELNPQERVRMRSASIISKASSVMVSSQRKPSIFQSHSSSISHNELSVPAIRQSRSRDSSSDN